MMVLQVEWKVCGEECGPRSRQAPRKGNEEVKRKENKQTRYI